MATEPRRYRGRSWAAILYLMIGIVVLFVMVSSSMSEIHATGAFWQSAAATVAAIGTVLGLAGLIFTIVRARRSNVNLRTAILAWAFGTLVFALAFYGADEALEGPKADGIVILEFDDMDAARAWHGSPAYQEAMKHRQLGADYRVLLVDGVKPA